MKNVVLGIACFTLGMSQVMAAKPLNPFATESTLPMHAPLFNKIKDSDYQPAYKQAMREHLSEINKIANNPGAPTFDNTIVAMEKSGRMLDRVSETFLGVVQANTNKTLDQVQTNEAPKLAAHQDAIYLNSMLFARVKKIYDQRNALKLDPEAMQLLNVYYMQFVHAGANLNDVDKTKLRMLNKKLAILEAAFQQKLVAGTKAGELSINNRTKLAGLDDHEVAALIAPNQKKDKYLISLQNTTQQPLLSSLTDRATREQLFMHSWNRTEKNDANDTRDIIATLAKLRAEKAKLLGYSDYASYILYDQMAKTPNAVHQFLSQLTPAVTKKAAKEAQDIQAIINQKTHFDLKPWDWNLYAEQIRKKQYDLNENELKPYFELNTVLQDGVFYAANKLYGVTFKERHDIPVYHPDVRVFDVFDKDGSKLGMIYFDFFKRDNKTGGAWMSTFVQQSKLLGTKAVVYNVTNFTKPAEGRPALISFDDVIAMFHEFGHALHGLFANTTYPMSNSNIARDFVEFPSQFNERWALYPTVLKNYAIHYKTHKPIPDELVDKIKRAATFNQGYAVGEILAASELDLQWHELPASAAKQNVDSFEIQALKNTHSDFANVPPRYRSSYFLHIWANGYSAGYYAYLWTEMLADDAYAWFTQHDGLTRENGQRFRDMILSQGHIQDYDRMFNQFYGKNPTIEPLLRQRGLE